MNWQPNQPLSNEEREAMEAGLGIHVEYEAPGSFVPKSNYKNDYLMDRHAQKEKRAYSGGFKRTSRIRHRFFRRNQNKASNREDGKKDSSRWK
jgi:hypothetical protein